MDLHSTRDKVNFLLSMLLSADHHARLRALQLTLVKAAYAPLALFCTVAQTARVTRDRGVFCLCCCGYLERGSGARGIDDP